MIANFPPKTKIRKNINEIQNKNKKHNELNIHYVIEYIY